MSFPRFLIGFVPVICMAAQAPAPKTAPAAAAAAKRVETPPNAPAVPLDQVVLSVGDDKLTAGEFEQLVDTLPEQYRSTARGAQKRQFAEQLVRVKILAQEARRRKLDQTPAIQKQMALQRDNLLAGALFQDLTANSKIDEAASRRFYDEHKSEYEQVRARHVLVRIKGAPTPAQPGKKELTDEEALAKAQELRKKLLAGEDFAALAKAESDDGGSGANGGDLGFFKRGRMTPPFEQAAFTLPLGQLSEPVKSQFGYHLIKVEQREAKTFDEVRPELEKRMRPDLARQMVEELRKQTPVTLDEGFFGPAPPVPPSPAAAK